MSYGSHGLQMFFPVLWVVFVYDFAMQRLLGLIRSHFKIFCFYFHNSGRVLSLLILMVSLYVHFNFFFSVLMFLSCLSVLARISSTECNRSAGSSSAVLSLVLQGCFQQGLLFHAWLEKTQIQQMLGF